MKRKIVSVLLCVLLLASLLPVSAFADTTASGTCGANLTWELDSNGTLTISGTGAMKNYDPSNNDTTAPWGKNCSLIKSVVISDGVTSIGDYAFSGCSSLTSATIGNGVRSIGYGAFSGCSSLTSVTIGNGVTSIGISAFYNCSSLTSVTIPDSVTSIGNSAFSGCSSLTSVTIGNSVTSIEVGAFSGCSKIKVVNYDGNIESWLGIDFTDGSSNPCDGSALYFKGELVTNAVIPDSITSIKNWSFYGCSSLTSVTIPDSVTSIGSGAFYNCSSLTSVTIPDSVTSIGDYAFSGCSSLTGVTIPDSVTGIGDGAFSDCSSLTSVTIPDSVTRIGYSAFSGCSSLTSVTIPDSVTSIGGYAFFGCSSLTSVTIGNGVTSIGDYAFKGCSSLTSVTIPDSVTSISNHAFYNCSSLTSVTIGNSVTSIGSWAFYGCSKLKDIAFAGSKDAWASIEKGGVAFSTSPRIHYNCTTLEGHIIPVERKDPSCTSTGYIKYSCACGYKYTELLPENHDYVFIKSVAATCSNAGYDVYKCSKCGKILNKSNGEEQLPHEYEFTKVVEPTCLKGGYTLYKCSVCGDEYKDNLTPLLGHSMVEVGEKPATCAEVGHTAGVQCSRCGTIESGVTEIPALGHSYGACTQTKAPTCTAKGTEVRTCTRCNATETRDVEVLGHNTTHHAAKAATCTEIGWEAYDTCSRCDYTTYKEIPATGHHHNAVVTAPTCTAKGYTTHTCACGDSYVESYTDALGHSYGAWTQTKAPTCTAKGTETRTCTRCNATETRDVEALGHNTTHHAAKAATCTEIGWEAYDTCSRCDYTTYEEIPALGHSYANGKCTRCGAADPNYKPAPKAPELKITTSAGKPKIYWNAVDGAVKYWVYRSTDSKNFKYYDSTTKTSYTNNSTTIGTLYYYKVKAVKTENGKDYASDYSVIRSIRCKPAAPSVSINRSNGKPKLSWKAVSGATKYWIYRSTDGKEFKYFDSTTKTSYTNSGAASGTKYYYRVKAVAVVNGKNVTSANSSTKSLLTSLAKPSVSITTSNGKPKITWKAVTGADKYYVYRSTDGKTFSYWDSTTKTTYINSGAKKNTKYYYKVKAVCASNSNANSAQSSAVSIKATK